MLNVNLWGLNDELRAPTALVTGVERHRFAIEKTLLEAGAKVAITGGTRSGWPVPAGRLGHPIHADVTKEGTYLAAIVSVQVLGHLDIVVENKAGSA